MLVRDIAGAARRSARRHRLVSETLVSAAAADPVDVGAMKLHARVDISDDDALIEGLITAATKHLETYTGRSFVTQTWDQRRDQFPDEDEPLWLRRGPLQSVTSITYIDINGATQTLASSTYTVDTGSPIPRVVPAYNESWPDTRDEINAVIVRSVMGYGAAAAVPELIKLAIKLLVGEWYDHREDAEVIIGGGFQPLQDGIRRILDPYRVEGGIG